MDLNGNQSAKNNPNNAFPERTISVREQDRRLSKQHLCESCNKRALTSIDSGGLCRICRRDLDQDIDVTAEVHRLSIPSSWRNW